MNSTKKTKFISIKDKLFTPLEKCKMSKIFGGNDPTAGTDPHSFTNKDGVVVTDSADPYTD